MNTSRHSFTQARRFILACAAAATLPIATWSGALHADTVAIPLGQQGKAWNIETPRHGITKSQVQARFGAPDAQSGPVGEPPIYKWTYDQFSVYFEGDRVIHSVVQAPEKSR